MREVADKIGIIEQLAQAIHDQRHQSYVKHELIELLIQRIFQIIFRSHKPRTWTAIIYI